jgi:Raf kinase inhibitor-like YbhB/YbcL family protein
MDHSAFHLFSNDLKGTFSMDQVFNQFGCTGSNNSPHLAWNNAPEGTKSFAIFMHDPDAPTHGGFWHWVVYNIPASTTSLPAGAGNPESNLLDEGVLMGKADAGANMYCGPCPPPGDFTHRYEITIYALNTDKMDGVDEETPVNQAEFRVVTEWEIARATLTAHFRRPA